MALECGTGPSIITNMAYCHNKWPSHSIISSVVRGITQWKNYSKDASYLLRFCVSIVIHGYGSKCPQSFNYHLRLLCEIVTEWRNVHLCPLAFYRHVTPKDDQVTTLCAPWTTPSVTVARNSNEPCYIYRHCVCALSNLSYICVY